jgi:hypothetical protein
VCRQILTQQRIGIGNNRAVRCAMTTATEVGIALSTRPPADQSAPSTIAP